MKKRKIYFLLALLYLMGTSYLFACTIFYAARNNMVLSGNNEDCSDPNTFMTFYPSEAGKLGWVKFGFQNGFPQGGMNECGLFWDAASTPYMAMPYSEEYKEKYNGVLMQKVIEECSTTQEVVAVFEEYYCDDLYNAQYLIGDSTGTSIIVEGDEIFGSNEDFQVMTNFCQSQYEPGNFPCWRYNTVKEMLQNGDEISTVSFGWILSATHQQGNYPTQYSNIYDNKNCIIYLFRNHNYEEYITIDLSQELEKGFKDYNIPSLFSSVNMIYPDYEEVVNSTSVTFRWEGKANCTYELYCSTDPGFSDCEPILIESFDFIKTTTPGLNLLFSGIFISGFLGLLRKRVFLKLIPVFFVVFILLGCSQNSTSPSGDDIIEFSQTVENLEPDTTYYWKLIAHSDAESDFSSETVVYPFYTTGN
ncbi:MAG: hypothetical protein HQ534_05580 [Armatimonadetes bacterium]|nr:hypothetical protein [Armatimonadota bacterium]